jgi:hypothetical protein
MYCCLVMTDKDALIESTRTDSGSTVADSAMRVVNEIEERSGTNS